jgi:hypothetical protein
MDEAAIKDVENLEYLSRKTLQAYSIRNTLFLRRYLLLASIERDYDKIGVNPQFYDRLNHCLEEEKKLLGILENSGNEIKNNIAFALMQFLEIERKMNRTIKDIPLPHNKALSAKEASKFLKQIIEFLTQVIQDIRGIRKRMFSEEIFLSRKTKESFKMFIEDWEKEAAANQKLDTKMEYILKIHRRLIDTMRFDWISFGGIAIALGAPINAAMWANGGDERNLYGAGAFLLAGAAVIVANFIAEMAGISRKSLVESQREMVLLKDLEKKWISSKTRL